MNQNERLDYLAEQFAKDYDETVRRTASPYEKASMQYRKLEIPDDAAGKWRLLRSLMNVRMPGKLPSSVLEVQDAYLKERILENGIVQIADLPTAADQGSSHPHAEHICLAGRHHETGRRRDRKCGEFADAGMFCPDAQLH